MADDQDWGSEFGTRGIDGEALDIDRHTCIIGTQVTQKTPQQYPIQPTDTNYDRYWLPDNNCIERRECDPAAQKITDTLQEILALLKKQAEEIEQLKQATKKS